MNLWEKSVALAATRSLCSKYKVKLLGWQIGPIRSQASLLDVPNRGQSLQTIHRLGKQEIRAVTVVYQVVLCGKCGAPGRALGARGYKPSFFLGAGGLPA